jgi:hypothetical protein
MQDLGYELPRISILRTSVNKASSLHFWTKNSSGIHRVFVIMGSRGHIYAQRLWRGEGPRAPLKKGRLFMKLRALLILATMVIGGMLLSGVVLAEKKHCDNNCRGTNSSDTLIGDNSKNTIRALGGGDVVSGLPGGDELYGGGSGDGMKGGPGRDYINGGTGRDRLDGKKSRDIIDGIDPSSYSSTARYKQPTVEVLIGGRGNDTIRARDGKKDIIRGGPGYDKANVDKVDKVKGVEKEVVPGGGGGTPQCKDGKDNDGDGKIDLQDPGCASATDDTESRDPQPIASKQCEDGKDNDNDGKIDFGNGANNDPGCDSLTDDSESPDPDTTPPVATIDSGPADGKPVIDTNSTSVTFTFSANEPSTFECQLSRKGTVEQAWAACTSPQSYSNLTTGSYTFELRATDTAKNTSDVVSRQFEVCIESDLVSCP